LLNLHKRKINVLSTIYMSFKNNMVTPSGRRIAAPEGLKPGALEK
jgi:hypothetical protein